MINKRTVCELCDKALTLFEDNYELENTILEIKERAEHMEDRLLAYCNAIEGLGFSRDGRDYTKQ